MTTMLHLLAFALSPKYYSPELLSVTSRVAPYRDVEVAQGYKAAIRRLFTDRDQRDRVRAEFMAFACSGSVAQNLDALRDKYRVDGHSWWYFHGQEYMHLQPLAIKFLSQISFIVKLFYLLNLSFIFCNFNFNL